VLLKRLNICGSYAADIPFAQDGQQMLVENGGVFLYGCVLQGIFLKGFFF